MEGGQVKNILGSNMCKNVLKQKGVGLACESECRWLQMKHREGVAPGKYVSKGSKTRRILAPFSEFYSSF